MKQRRLHKVRSTETPTAVVVGVCVLLVGLVLAAFGRSISADFVNYDDGEYVYDNPHINRGVSLGSVCWAFTHFHAANWHPVTTISHMVDVQLFGLAPWGPHLINVLLHATAALLLFALLRRLSGMIWPSAFVAGFFAVHPLRVESVAWISERKDLLSGIFFMLTLLAYAGYVEGKKRSLGRYFGVAGLFAIGLMCKPTLVTLPFVLLLLDYWPLKRTRDLAPGRKERAETWSSLVMEKIPLFALSVASAVVTLCAQKRALETHLNLSLPERVSNALVSYVAYLGQMIFPLRLAVLYPHPEGTLSTGVVSLALIFLVALTAVFVVWRRSYPFLLVGWLWYLVMLIPMIGLVQVGPQARADRYTYLSQIGLYLAAVWGLSALLRERLHGRAILAGVGMVFLAGFTIDSYAETGHWQNSEALWRNAIGRTDNNYIAYYNLGSLLLRKGDAQAALSNFQKAIGQKSDYEEAYASAGSASMLMGQLDRAISYYNEAIRLRPGSAEDWSNLASALLQEGKLNEGIEDARRAVALKPESADLRYNLGRALAAASDWTGAIASYRRALELQPGSSKVYNNLGVALAQAGETDEALVQIGEALRLSPQYADAQYNLGCILESVGRKDDAILHLNEALRLNPNYAAARRELQKVRGW